MYVIQHCIILYTLCNLIIDTFLKTFLAKKKTIFEDIYNIVLQKTINYFR